MFPASFCFGCTQHSTSRGIYVYKHTILTFLSIGLHNYMTATRTHQKCHNGQPICECSINTKVGAMWVFALLCVFVVCSINIHARHTVSRSSRRTNGIRRAVRLAASCVHIFHRARTHIVRHRRVRVCVCVRVRRWKVALRRCCSLERRASAHHHLATRRGVVRSCSVSVSQRFARALAERHSTV